jgi:Fic family protein
LEIEGNTLTIEQITDLINNKRVLAPRKDILEFKNAINEQFGTRIMMQTDITAKDEFAA